MQALAINDLSCNRELDKQALQATSGGRRRGGISVDRVLRFARTHFGVSGLGAPSRGSASFAVGPGFGGSANFGTNNTFQGATTGINNGIQIFNFNFA